MGVAVKGFMPMPQKVNTVRGGISPGARSPALLKEVLCTPIASSHGRAITDPTPRKNAPVHHPFSAENIHLTVLSRLALIIWFDPPLPKIKAGQFLVNSAECHLFAGVQNSLNSLLQLVFITRVWYRIPFRCSKLCRERASDFSSYSKQEVKIRLFDHAEVAIIPDVRNGSATANTDSINVKIKSIRGEDANIFCQIIQHLRHILRWRILHDGRPKCCSHFRSSKGSNEHSTKGTLP